MKIYVGEGYANFRKVLVDMCEYDGHEVAAAHDGPALRAMIAMAAPDVVVADLHLTGMSALKLVAELRQAGLRLPVVVMTTQPPDDIAEAVAALGAVRVLRKPFRLEVLHGAIAELLA